MQIISNQTRIISKHSTTANQQIHFIKSQPTNLHIPILNAKRTMDDSLPIQALMKHVQCEHKCDASITFHVHIYRQ